MALKGAGKALPVLDVLLEAYFFVEDFRHALKHPESVKAWTHVLVPSMFDCLVDYGFDVKRKQIEEFLEDPSFETFLSASGLDVFFDSGKEFVADTRKFIKHPSFKSAIDVMFSESGWKKVKSILGFEHGHESPQLPTVIESEETSFLPFDSYSHPRRILRVGGSKIAVLSDLEDKEHHGKPCGDTPHVPAGVLLPMGYVVDTSVALGISRFIRWLDVFVEGASREDIQGDALLSDYVQWINENMSGDCSYEIYEGVSPHGVKGAGLKVTFPAETFDQISSIFWYRSSEQGGKQTVFYSYGTEPRSQGPGITEELDIQVEPVQIEAPPARIWLDDSSADSPSFAAGSEDNVVHVAVHPKLGYAHPIDARGYWEKGDYHSTDLYMSRMTVTVRGVSLEDVDISTMRAALEGQAILDIYEENGVVRIVVDFLPGCQGGVLLFRHELENFYFTVDAPESGKVSVDVDYEFGEYKEAIDATPYFAKTTHGATGSLDIPLSPPHCFRSEVFLEGEETSALAAGEDNWIHVRVSRREGVESTAGVRKVTITLSGVTLEDVDVSAIREQYPDTKVSVEKTDAGKVAIVVTRRDGAVFTEEEIRDLPVKVHAPRDSDITIGVDYEAQEGVTTDHDSSAYHLPVSQTSVGSEAGAPVADPCPAIKHYAQVQQEQQQAQQLAAADSDFEKAIARIAASSASDDTVSCAFKKRNTLYEALDKLLGILNDQLDAAEETLQAANEHVESAPDDEAAAKEALRALKDRNQAKMARDEVDARLKALRFVAEDFTLVTDAAEEIYYDEKYIGYFAHGELGEELRGVASYGYGTGKMIPYRHKKEDYYGHQVHAIGDFHYEVSLVDSPYAHWYGDRRQGEIASGQVKVLRQEGSSYLTGTDGPDLIIAHPPEEYKTQGHKLFSFGHTTQEYRLFGFGGNDVLLGNAGNDILSGGDGNDHLEGRGGADQLFGEGGDDILFGNAGNDILSGGDGNDHLEGRGGADKLLGGRGDDILSGGDGNDHLEGSGGADQLFGEGGDDLFVLEQAGFRKLDGGSGNDTLRFSGATLGQNLDGNELLAHVSGVEKLEVFSGDGSHSRTLDLSRFTAEAIAALSDNGKVLRVWGEEGTKVDLHDCGKLEDAVRGYSGAKRDFMEDIFHSTEKHCKRFYGVYKKLAAGEGEYLGYDGYDLDGDHNVDLYIWHDGVEVI